MMSMLSIFISHHGRRIIDNWECVVVLSNHNSMNGCRLQSRTFHHDLHHPLCLSFRLDVNAIWNGLGLNMHLDHVNTC